MKLCMKNGYLAVRAIKEEKALASGIILPDEAGDDTQTAYCEVIAVNEGRDGSEYKVGDRVLFSKLAPDDVSVLLEKDTPEDLWFIKESDIKAILK